VGHLVGWEHNLPMAAVCAALKRLDEAGLVTFWYNFKFDGEVAARQLGFTPQHWREVLFYVWLYDCDHKRFGLKEATKRILGLEQPTFKALTANTNLNFAELDPSAQDTIDYACADCDCTRRLALHARVQAMVKRQEAVYQLEHAFLDALRATLNNGGWIDIHRLRELDERIGAPIKSGKKILRPMRPGGQIADLDAQIRVALKIPEDANLDSPKQMVPYFLAAGFPLTEKSEKTGAFLLNKKVLAQLAAQYPIVEQFVARRELITQSNNYIRKLIAAHDHFGANVRFPFSQLGAPTGRMSSGGEGRKAREAFDRGYVNLNIQSLPDPKKKPYLPDIRSAIVADDPDNPDPDPWTLVAIDYSQIELRLAANLSREPLWINAFQNGVDIHAVNARVCLGDPTIDKDHPDRGKGKTASFAVLYGAQYKTVAKNVGISEDAAKRMLDNFWAGAPRVRTWVEATHGRAQIEKMVATWLGRIRPLHAFFYEGAPKGMIEKGKRESVNDLVQGGAADIFKIAMVRIHRMLAARGWQADVQMMYFVHDEIVLRIRTRLLDEAVAAIRAEMEAVTYGSWPIPYLTDAKVGPSWSERKLKDEPRAMRDWVPAARLPDAPPLTVAPEAPKRRTAPELPPLAAPSFAVRRPVIPAPASSVQS
jgi:DNA polymerase-1